MDGEANQASNKPKTARTYIKSEPPIRCFLVSAVLTYTFLATRMEGQACFCVLHFLWQFQAAMMKPTICAVCCVRHNPSLLTPLAWRQHCRNSEMCVGKTFLVAIMHFSVAQVRLSRRLSFNFAAISDATFVIVIPTQGSRVRLFRSRMRPKIYQVQVNICNCHSGVTDIEQIRIKNVALKNIF